MAIHLSGSLALTGSITVGTRQTNTGTLSSIAGGTKNTGSTSCSFIGGGQLNHISGSTAQNFSFIGGGYNNQVLQGCAVIGGGSNNTNCGLYGTVGGGAGNDNLNQGATIAGGYHNKVSGLYSTAGGGSFNSASADYSTIAGGHKNTGSGDYSGILGGRNNYVSHNDSFAIGSNLTSTAICTAYFNNINVQTTASAVYFSGSFVGDGSGLTLPAGVVSSSAQILPITTASITNFSTEVSRSAAASGFGGGGGGADSDWYDGTTYISSSVDIIVTGSISGNNKLTIGSNQTNTGTLTSIAGGTLNTASASGSFIGGGVQNTILTPCSVIGGGCLNSISGSTTQFSFIGGGRENLIKCLGIYSAIVAGCGHYISASNGFIGAGTLNSIENNGSYSAIVAGGYNKTNGQLGFIGAGIQNLVGGNHAVVVGGQQNTASAACSGILGGLCNYITHNHSFAIGSNLTSTAECTTFVNNLNVETSASAVYISGSFVGDGSGLTGISGGGCSSFPHSPYITGSTNFAIIPSASDAATSIGAYSTIAGGRHNEIKTTSNNSFIGSGCRNCITQGFSFIGAGCKNTGSTGCTFIGAGRNNFNQGSSAGIVAGWENKICNLAYYGFIGAGQCNTLAGGNQHAAIVGGCNNILNDNTDGGIIGAGKSNTISNGACCSGILGGVSNTVDHDKAFIIGSNLTTTAACYTFVNNLCNVGGGTSDCRLKENIVNIPYGLTHISQLNPVSFNFKDDESKKIKYGFLAQCVQEVMPDLVYHHPTDLVDGDPVLQFDREAIWASTINAIKDLKQQVEVLKAEIEILKQQ